MRVGTVGANAKASWAKVSHVPAINGLPGLKLAAVATRNEQSAREAAQAIGAECWFSDPFAMILGDRIDVIGITVRVNLSRSAGDGIDGLSGCREGPSRSQFEPDHRDVEDAARKRHATRLKSLKLFEARFSDL